MPFDSNGTFNRVRSWVSDAQASIKIRSDYHDDHDGDLADGLSTCITKDGRTQPLANIPLNNKKIVNLGEPTNPADAATKGYVDTFKNFSTGSSITGAGPINGFIQFAAPTGVNGIGWTTADMSWVGRLEEADKYSKRLAVNDAKDGTGTDVFSIDEAGRFNTTGTWTRNLSFDGVKWRSIAAGKVDRFTLLGGGFQHQSNATDTVVAFQEPVLFTDFEVTGNGQIARLAAEKENTSLRLQKEKDEKYNEILGYNGTAESGRRWRMVLGNAIKETETRTGCDFAIQAYDNSGAAVGDTLTITRKDGHVHVAAGVIDTPAQSLILSSSHADPGQIVLRPEGPTNTTRQCFLDTVGDWHISDGHLKVDANTTRGSYLGMGFMGKNGTLGGIVSAWHNFIWSGGYVYCLVNNSNVGAIQMVCDHRTKTDDAPLPSMWDKVKALKPISYKYKEFSVGPGAPPPPQNNPAGGPAIPDASETRWGFVAHELQQTLTKSAATFQKDAPNALQSPNLMALCAALTKALQEAMARIEALEAKA